MFHILEICIVSPHDLYHYMLWFFYLLLTDFVNDLIFTNLQGFIKSLPYCIYLPAGKIVTEISDCLQWKQVYMSRIEARLAGNFSLRSSHIN